MGAFSSIFGQKQPIRILTALLKKRKIPHALLFSGIKGIGKQTAAMAFAQACNCTASNHDRQAEPRQNRSNPPDSALPPDVGACGRCKSCKKIEAESHPDVIRVKPSGVFIKIDQIRALCGTLAMRPYEGKWRVVVIVEAQAMNRSAANALLKVLEEPPPQTLIILTCEGTSDLLPTIVSRCQHIRFKPIPADELAADLMDNQGIEPDQARILAAMANGSHAGALDMARGTWFAHRTWLLGQMGNLSSQPLAQVLALAEKLSKNKKDLPDSLGIILSWLRDTVIFTHAPDRIIHKDLADTIRHVSEKTDVSIRLAQVKATEAAIARIRTNANTRLAMESLMLELSELI